MKCPNDCDCFFEILTRVRPVRIAALHKWVMMAIISSDGTGQKDAE
jgi:hypothetical protein